MNRDDQNAAKPEFAATLLYDAECGLCRACMRWLRKRDRHRHLRFEPLQSEIGQSHLRRLGLPTQDFDSLVFVCGSEKRTEPRFLLRTDALVAALKCCGGWTCAAGTLLALVPRKLRDAAYSCVARLRHHTSN